MAYMQKPMIRHMEINQIITFQGELNNRFKQAT
jgi:hypothetical protein